MDRSLKVARVGIAAMVLALTWTLDAVACDQRGGADPGDQAAKLKLEQLLLKHRPRLVVQGAAAERSGR